VSVCFVYTNIITIDDRIVPIVNVVNHIVFYFKQIDFFCSIIDSKWECLCCCLFPIQYKYV